jgi:hypothetical protein
MDELIDLIEGFCSRKVDAVEITSIFTQIDEEGRNVKQDIKENPEFAERYFAAWGVPKSLRADPQKAIKWMKKKRVVDTYVKLVHKAIDEQAILLPVAEGVATQDRLDKKLEVIRNTKRFIPWSLVEEDS